MWLLNTQTFRLQEFQGASVPAYVILSHRWEEDEVGFGDVGKFWTRSKKGWTKVKKFCALAKSYGYAYAWMDTCCIDKSSSAELSEAINSMFNWYSNSEMCFIFLSDVTKSNEANIRGEFIASQWFTRGWTLQELLAPSRLVFFDRNWNALAEIRTLDEMSHSNFLAWIEEASGIDVVRDRQSLMRDEISIAKRMSWASGRQTTRPEDIAYCLLGLFNVNMPLLYGEGAAKAFYRLQVEILGLSSDQSLFAWNYIPTQPGLLDPHVRGLLAQSPQNFQNSSMYSAFRIAASQEYSMTNIGLKITVQLTPFWPEGPCGPVLYGMELHCLVGDSDLQQNGMSNKERVHVYLLRLDDPAVQNKFTRLVPVVGKASETKHPLCACYRQGQSSFKGSLQCAIDLREQQTIYVLDLHHLDAGWKHDNPNYRSPRDRSSIAHNPDCPWAMCKEPFDFLETHYIN